MARITKRDLLKWLDDQDNDAILGVICEIIGEEALKGLVLEALIEDMKHADVWEILGMLIDAGEFIEKQFPIFKKTLRADLLKAIVAGEDMDEKVVVESIKEEIGDERDFWSSIK